MQTFNPPTEFKNLDRELYKSLEQHTGEGDELKASYTQDAIDQMGEQDDYSEGDNN